MIEWKIHHKAETVSTNLDAKAGKHADVFTADFQTAGRGRLDHKWVSKKGENLMMSVVVSVEDLPPERVATLPLVVGASIADAILPEADIKWPNDIWYRGKKLAGILCERYGDNVIIGIGVNVGSFPEELSERSTSLKAILGGAPELSEVRDAILRELGTNYLYWSMMGFKGVLHDKVIAYDFLRGKRVLIRQTDDDEKPIEGLCEGIAEDGSLIVGGKRIYAGEAHVEGIFQ